MTQTGIISYGVYIPKYRIKVEEIAKIWQEDADELISQMQVVSKSIQAPDEDVITMSVSAAQNAMKRWKGDPLNIGAIYVGSESHPYAVKPTATIVGAAIECGPNYTSADLEFACKAGTAGMQMCFGLIDSNMIDVGLAIGADSSQARPRDPLEYTAGAGAAAFLLGKDKPIAVLEGTYSVTSDTPDFWRREGADYPSHGQRFTGQPAYFKHVVDASKGLMEKLGTKPQDYTYATFHQPNTKFPLAVGGMLGFTNEQIDISLACREIGNTYSAASMIALAKILDHAKPNDRIFVTSYGSGAGSDAFSFLVTEHIEEMRSTENTVDYYLNRKQYIDYGQYAMYKGIIKV